MRLPRLPGPHGPELRIVLLPTWILAFKVLRVLPGKRNGGSPHQPNNSSYASAANDILRDALKPATLPEADKHVRTQNVTHESDRI